MTTIATQDGPPVYPGYHWSARINADVTPVLFPAGVALVAHVRIQPGAPLLATLTTANGGVVRVSDTEIDLILTEAQTAALPAGFISIDVARTDLTHWQFLGFMLSVPVIPTVTEPA